MSANRIHSLKISSKDKIVPNRFTYPFCYIPHPLCKMAAKEVMAYLDGREDWNEELRGGKMFGVLIVDYGNENLGYLAAYSGLLDGKNDLPYFVPSIVDTLSETGYFKTEERAISAINRKISDMETQDSRQEKRMAYYSFKTKAEETLADAKRRYKSSKLAREKERSEGASAFRLSEMEAESQFQKAELKRLKDRLNLESLSYKEEIDKADRKINAMKEERRARSAALQNWLFSQYRLLNGRGEEKDLLEIFAPTPQRIPPAAAGDCAAPKLLQYAFVHGMRPIAMAEFWYGDSPKGEVRKHGQFYPACVGRCGPILGFMLQGLNVEPNPKEEKSSAFDSIRIICEDDYMIAVDKPSGLLSAPGKVSDVCVQTVLRKIRPESERYFVVHRLDMDTSGVLLLAKDEETYKRLQSMFAGREMKKEYVALLNGVVRDDGGEITLPLSADYVNRPCQKVDFEKGKPAVTVYEVISRRGEETLIRFRPHTGRTHQLRVHSAHNLGLGAPIKGDSLYGTPSDRLYLHAESLTFVHPVTGCDVVIRSECPFSL